MDNLRRELRREDRPVPTFLSSDRRPQTELHPEPNTLCPSDLVEFERLPLHQQKIAGCAVEAFGAYLEALEKTISLFMDGKSKARKAAGKAQNAAMDLFIVAGAVLVGTILEDSVEKRPGFWSWYKKFYDSLSDEEQLTWEDFGNTITEDSLTLYIAQQISDSPANIKRWRGYLTSESWS